MLPTTYGLGPNSMIGIAVLGITWATVGTFVVIRRPGNPIGRLMVAIGAGFAVSVLTAAVTFAALAEGSAEALKVASITAEITGLSTLIIVLMGYLPFIFPTGRGPTPRWHAVGMTFLVVGISNAMIQLVHPGDVSLLPGIRNPLGFGPDLRPVFGDPVARGLDAVAAAVFLPLMVLSVRARYRRATEIERQQLKWFAVAAIAAVTAVAATSSIGAVVEGPMDQTPLVGIAVAGTLIPLAIGVAILRYHLYEIDRIISRTIAYALVIGVIGVVFGGGFVLLGAALASFANGQTIAVAGATLVAYAVFQPVLRRVRQAVDRRFDRAHYDAERTGAAFGQRLREETDLATITADVAGTARSALAPAVLGVWLRERGR
jgi:hypothetical protein